MNLRVILPLVLVLLLASACGQGLPPAEPPVPQTPTELPAAQPSATANVVILATMTPEAPADESPPPAATESPAPAADGSATPVAAAETATPVPTGTAPPTVAAPTSTPLPTVVGQSGGPPSRPTEAIVIMEPASGSRVTSPLRLRGEANPTFEQNLIVRMVTADGEEMSLQPTTIQADAGQRGPFTLDIPFTRRWGTKRVHPGLLAEPAGRRHRASFFGGDPPG